MTQPTVLQQEQGENWALYNSDCVTLSTAIPDNSIDIAIYSPPFSSLYIYGDSEADMGNTDDDAQFLDQYRFMVREKYRVLRPGRISAVHIKDLVYYQNSSADGSSGIRPLSDEVTRLHLEEGFTLHCRIMIWRDPVLERSKTNAHGLLWKTFQADGSFCRVGMPEYLMIYRKWAKPGLEHLVRPVVHPKTNIPLTVWQELASPVWPVQADATLGYPAPVAWNYSPGQSGKGDLDMRSTDTLNVRQARDEKAEKHLCPMPLNITGRALGMYTNEGDTVFSPFAGIGSEGVEALRMKRRFIGSELHPLYYREARKHLEDMESQGQQVDLLDVLGL